MQGDPPPPSLDEMLGLSPESDDDLSHTTGAAIAHVRAFGSLVRQTLHHAVRPGEPGAVATQLYEIGVKSAVFLCVAMGFIGMIFVYQAGLQMKRVIPDLSQLGATYLELLVRDLAASICALLLATRVGAGIAAELGSMVVTEQIDALRMCAADPVRFLVRPRFVASVAMTLVLTLLAGTVAFATGLWTAQVFFAIHPQTFADASLVDRGDVVVGGLKCLAYGAAIPLISADSGLATRGGSAGVGQATTRAVVGSSLAVIVLNFVISAIGFAVFG
ncbi:MAG: ABC transporter permease [Deltaproteobacteria bacterium]|nr:ABC transporter permease [Deltaproteobacteria bacterium]